MVKLHEMIDMCKTAAAQHARAAISVTQKYPQYSAVHAKNRDVIPQLYRDLFGSAPPSLINPTVKTCQQTQLSRAITPYHLYLHERIVCPFLTVNSYTILLCILLSKYPSIFVAFNIFHLLQVLCYIIITQCFYPLLPKISQPCFMGAIQTYVLRHF